MKFEYSYNSLKKTDEELVEDGIKFFIDILGGNEEDKDNLKTTCVEKFVRTVLNGYRENPFHSKKHALSVLQMGCIIMNDMDLPDYFVLALLISCIGHDIEHFGRTNQFLKETNHKWFEESSQSPLEYHHLSVLQQILKQPDQNIIHIYLNNEEKEKKCKELIDLCVMATDMIHHKELTNELIQLLAENGDDKSIELTPEFLNKHEKLLARIIMKSADISNELRPYEVAVPWAYNLTEEWYSQGDEEKKLGLNISKGFDRSLDQPNSTPKGQVGFINFVTTALYTNAVKVFPNLKQGVDNMKYNLSQWEEKSK